MSRVSAWIWHWRNSWNDRCPVTRREHTFPLGGDLPRISPRSWREVWEEVERIGERTREEAGEVGSRVGRHAAEAAVQSVTSSVLGKKDAHSAQAQASTSSSLPVNREH